MAYRSTLRRIVQLGAEATPGTSVAANRVVRAIYFAPKLQRVTGQARWIRNKYQTSNVGHRVWADGTYDGPMCYNAISYVLSNLLMDPAASQNGWSVVSIDNVTGGGGYPDPNREVYTWEDVPNVWFEFVSPFRGFPSIAAANGAKGPVWIENRRRAFDRTYLSSNSTADARKTYTLEDGDSDAVDRFSYCQLTTLNLNMSQDEAKMSGQLFARQPAFNQAITASPTVVPTRPVLRRHVNVYLATNYAAIASNQITDAFQETLAISEKWKPVWEHNNAGSLTFRRAAEMPPVVTCGFMTPHNSQSRGYLDSLLDGQVRYLRIQATGDQIATNGVTPVFEQIIADVAGKFDVADDESEQDVHARRYTLHSIYDATLGAALKIQTTNSLATL